ncbi:uncharacterized protein LOC117781456 [Drosophila innubila]|uniref:uncharacterized protein LOC117781456 n=1 Tax=Drosophila innubila TaxID=198719 RepID=UPI00148DC33E|nr:uncharacterized protein LOC117781456 [Drosophila innubila]
MKNYIYFKVYLLFVFPVYCYAQDYEVADVQCTFSTVGSDIEDLITATLKRPVGFKGVPIFADDRNGVKDTNPHCIISRDNSDVDERTYSLRINDFTRCGVLKRNGFVHVRIWFPQFPGVVMQSDQELIIMCKPPEPTIIENKAAGFAGSFPHGARVSGVVEETPNRLEYEVALYKEAPPIARVSGTNNPVSSSNDPPSSVASEQTVDQAVPLGTKLQLRARISQSVWKYVKLMEVTVSPDPENPHAHGAVSLVHHGCRNRELATIIPHQPAKYRDRPNEVFLDFEAFLLSSMKEKATLWIHSQIKACIDMADCTPDFCVDLYEPSGHGRRRRQIESTTSRSTTPKMQRPHSVSNTTSGSEFKRFKENIEYTVIMPGQVDKKMGLLIDLTQHCRGALLISSFFVFMITFCFTMSCMLAFRVQADKKLRSLQFRSGFNTGYAGRAVVQ